MAGIGLLAPAALALFVLAQASAAADRSLQILSFTSADCQPCQSMQPILTQLSRDGWQIRQIDVAEQPELVKPFNVTSLPTIVVLHQRREVERVVGTLGYSKLAARLDQAAHALNQSQSQNQLQSQSQNLSQTLAEATTVRGQSPEEFALATASPAPIAPRGMLALNAPSAAVASRGSNANSLANNLVPNNLVPNSSLINNSLASNSSPSGQSPRGGLSPVERAQRATVRIRVEDANSIAFGTGTVINMHGDQALVLTCGHVFRDLAPSAVLSIDLFDQGRTLNVPAQVVWFTVDEGDLGLMEFRAPVAIEAVPVASSGLNLQPGEPAFSFGCDHGADPTRRDTQIKRINRYIGPANIEIVGAPVLGRSGGGLFNAQGELVGVCNAADFEDDEGIYAGLPVIHQHLAALQLDQLNGGAVQAASGSLRGPNSAPTIPAQLTGRTAATSNAASMLDNASAQAASDTPVAAAQLHCIIRDQQGRETTLTIDRPSAELLALLRSKQ